MRVLAGRAGTPSTRSEHTFTGEVWADAVMTDHPGVKINSVIFTPCARTYWHFHEHGQILQVFRGRGYITGEDGTTREITQGDTVWIEAGEHHWHGGGEDSLMGHTAISLGETTWLDEVTNDEYARAAAAVRHG